jgi:K+-sensing histidine kinase KdpD
LARTRRGWDAQPTDNCAVLLASDGRQDFSKRAVARAAALAGTEPVGVVRIAKIFGSSFGVPHPGLLPTKQELTEHRDHVDKAIRGLRKSQVTADGQVAATRRAGKKLAEIALVRRARVIVIDETEASGWRRVIEGDVGSELRRKLRHTDIEVDIVPAHNTHERGSTE